MLSRCTIGYHDKWSFKSRDISSSELFCHAIVAPFWELSGFPLVKLETTQRKAQSEGFPRVADALDDLHLPLNSIHMPQHRRELHKLHHKTGVQSLSKARMMFRVLHS